MSNFKSAFGLTGNDVYNALNYHGKNGMTRVMPIKKQNREIVVEKIVINGHDSSTIVELTGVQRGNVKFCQVNLQMLSL